MPEILMQNVDFSYRERSVFTNLSLQLSGSGIYALIGPSGSGKTTLLRLLLGLIKPSSGSIHTSSSPAVAFQEYRLFPHLTAAENVAIITASPKEHHKAACDLLISLGFTDREVNLLPSKLSGGMKQRVSIARALFSNADILLLDEPTKELDENLRRRLYDLLIKRAETSLILLSTHRVEEVEILGAKTILIP